MEPARRNTAVAVDAQAAVLPPGPAAESSARLQIKARKKACAQPSWMQILEDRGVAIASANRARKEKLADLHGQETPETVHKVRTDAGTRDQSNEPPAASAPLENLEDVPERAGQPGERERAGTPIAPRAITYSDAVDPPGQPDARDVPNGIAQDNGPGSALAADSRADPLDSPDSSGSSVRESSARSTAESSRPCSTERMQMAPTALPCAPLGVDVEQERKVNLEAPIVLFSEATMNSVDCAVPMLQRNAGTARGLPDSKNESVEPDTPVSDNHVVSDRDAPENSSSQLVILGNSDDVLVINGVALDGEQGLSTEVKSSVNLLLKNMKRQQNEVAIQAQSCIFLWRYVTTAGDSKAADTRKVAAGKAGAIAQLLLVMQKHPHQVLLSELACWCLGAICDCAQNASKALLANAHKQVLSAMCRFPASPGMQAQGCWFLLVLITRCGSAIPKVNAAGAVKCVQAALDAHPSARIAFYANACLSALTSCASPQMDVQHTGQSWEGFVRDLHGYRDDPEKQMRSFQILLQNAATFSRPSTMAIPGQFSKELMQAILDALDAHHNHSRLVEICFRILASLSSNGDFRTLTSKLGGVSKILEAMDRLQEINEVQESGCSVLSALALSYEISSEILRNGGRTRILNAMEKNKQHVGVQREGCRAIRNLISSSSTAAESVLSIVRVLDTIQLHVPDGDAVEQAFMAFANIIANDDGTCAREAARRGCIEIFIKAMQLHSESSRVQHLALLCLRNLCTIDSIQIILAQSNGGLDAITKALTRHMNSAELVSEACKCLSNVSRQPQNHVIMVNAGCLQCLLATLDFYVNDTVIEEQAILALYCLSCHFREVLAKVKDMSGEVKIHRAVCNPSASNVTGNWGRHLLNHLASLDAGAGFDKGVGPLTCTSSSDFIGVTVGGEASVALGNEKHVAYACRTSEGMSYASTKRFIAGTRGKSAKRNLVQVSQPKSILQMDDLAPDPGISDVASDPRFTSAVPRRTAFVQTSASQNSIFTPDPRT